MKTMKVDCPDCNGVYRKLPCSHPGCYSHISHPCEGCGRVQGFCQNPHCKNGKIELVEVEAVILKRAICIICHNWKTSYDMQEACPHFKYDEEKDTCINFNNQLKTTTAWVVKG